MTEQSIPDTGFKLAPLVREVLDATGETDPDVLAVEVLARIASYDRETALHQAIRRMIVSTAFRPAFLPPAEPAPETAPAPAAAPPAPRAPQVVESPARPDMSDERRAELRRVAAGPPAPSPKVAAIREAWARALEQAVATPEGRKAFGDCTVVDLEYAANLRQRQAEHNLQRAADLRHVATVMRQRGAATVRALPAGALQQLSA